MKKKYKYILVVIILLIIYFSQSFIYINTIKYSDMLYNYEKKFLKVNSFIKDDDKYVFTKILYRDIYEFNKEITIYKGSASGIKKDMLVVDTNGIIGIIDKVYKGYSTVLLLTNKDINISIKVGNVYGSLVNIDGKLVVTNLTSNIDVSNMKIYTSGYSKYSSDILIGTTLDKKDNVKNIYHVRLSANLDSISDVIVIKDIR